MGLTLWAIHILLSESFGKLRTSKHWYIKAKFVSLHYIYTCTYLKHILTIRISNPNILTILFLCNSLNYTRTIFKMFSFGKNSKSGTRH